MNNPLQQISEQTLYRSSGIFRLSSDERLEKEEQDPHGNSYRAKTIC